MRHAIGAALGLLIAMAPAAAHAQYFGQNKVQYHQFDFKVLATPHFDVYYYPSEQAAAEQAGRIAERWYARFSKLLNHQLSSRQPLILYASHPEFEQTNVVEGFLGEGTGGVTEGLQRRITLPLGTTLEETNHVIGHELVHAFQYDMMGARNGDMFPLWFMEGMAEYLSIGPVDPQTAMWLRDAALEDALPSIGDLDNPKYFPYRFGQAFWAYLTGRYGDQVIAQVMHSFVPGRQSAGPMAIITKITGADEKTLTRDWQSSIRDAYHIAAGAGPPPIPEGEVVLGNPKGGPEELNVGPSLSPDGKRIAFLSGRGRLSIDLYLADATTGEVTRKLISTAVDPHFGSLEFIAAAGAWDAAGKRLAIASVADGVPELTIVDADQGSVAREIKFPNLGELFQPTWAPDGHAIAFSAQQGGFTDLFVYDFTSGQTKRLTNDQYGDLEPAWSPDGKRLAFVTDRFSANLRTLDVGRDQLAMFDLSSGAIAPIDAGVAGSAIDPHWSADGRSLFFVSNAAGLAEAYRLDLASGRSEKLTSEITGVAGITPLSPAISIATAGDMAAVTVFRDRGYQIRVLNLARLTAHPSPPPVDGTDEAALPPAQRKPSDLLALMGQPQTALPEASAFPSHGYRPHYALLAAGEDVGVATTSDFGSYVMGGASLLFSDVLGDRLIGVGIAANGGFADIAAEASYVSRVHRWNWGLSTDRVPYLTGSISETLDPNTGLVTDQFDQFRQTYQEFGAMTAYPFSHATRVELGADASYITFTHDIETTTFTPDTGQVLSDTTQHITSEPSLTLYDTSAAVVHDTAVFGATSPLMGRRLRLEATPTFGDLQFTNVLVDARQYYMPVRPITLAGRIIHVGRYGGNGDDQRLTPLFLGYPTLVRGYDVGTFDTTECVPNATSSCPQFDNLVGSRILVANVEVRAPLVGLFTGQLSYGPVPIEIFAFGDAGIAWTRMESPSFSGGPRQWVESVGAGLRVNMLGFAIGEFNAVRTLSLPRNGWQFVFNLRPGF